MSETQVYVSQDTLLEGDEFALVNLKGTKRGELVIMDFFTEQAIEENAYQVRAGTKSTAITGDVAITDPASEMCADATTGVTIIPVEAWISLNNEGGDAVEVAIKSVGSVSSAGTSFTPLNLCIGGKGAMFTARTKTAGGCTVTAEAATTTRQHYHVTKEYAKDSAAEWQGGNICNPHPRGGDLGMRLNPIVWSPAILPVLKGSACVYIQIASASTGPGYFAHLDVIELPTDCVA